MARKSNPLEPASDQGQNVPLSGDGGTRSNLQELGCTVSCRSHPRRSLPRSIQELPARRGSSGRDLERVKVSQQISQGRSREEGPGLRRISRGRRHPRGPAQHPRKEDSETRTTLETESGSHCRGRREKLAEW